MYSIIIYFFKYVYKKLENYTICINLENNFIDYNSITIIKIEFKSLILICYGY